jgi:hypothetical protein
MELCGRANWWMPGRRAPKAISAAQAGPGRGQSLTPRNDSGPRWSGPLLPPETVQARGAFTARSAYPTTGAPQAAGVTSGGR